MANLWQYEKALEDLKLRFPDCLLLDVEQIAQVFFDTHPQHIRNLIQRNTFPLVVRRVGRRLGVSIYDLAMYVSTGQSQRSDDDSSEPVKKGGRPKIVKMLDQSIFESKLRELLIKF